MPPATPFAKLIRRIQPARLVRGAALCVMLVVGHAGALAHDYEHDATEAAEQCPSCAAFEALDHGDWPAQPVERPVAQQEIPAASGHRLVVMAWVSAQFARGPPLASLT